MVGGIFSISTARHIRLLNGSCSNSGGSAATLPLRYVLFDHDAKFGNDVFEFLHANGITPLRTSVRSPWRNGGAERCVGSARREILDDVIPLRVISVGLVMSFSPTITKTVRTSDWIRPRLPCGRSNYVPPTRVGFTLDLESAVFITATIGQRLPDSPQNILASIISA